MLNVHGYLASLLFLTICFFILISSTGCDYPGEPEYEGTFLSNHKTSEFSVVDHKGRTTTNFGRNENPSLLTFLFTNCTDVCPIVTSSIRRALALLEDPKEVRVIVVSVDPEGDTEDSVQKYISKWSLGDNWSYVTGPEELLQPIWESYFVNPQLDHSVKNTLNKSFSMKYRVTHTSPVYILDRLGKAKILHTNPIDPKSLAGDIKILGNK